MVEVATKGEAAREEPGVDRGQPDLLRFRGHQPRATGAAQPRQSLSIAGRNNPPPRGESKREESNEGN